MERLSSAYKQVTRLPPREDTLTEQHFVNNFIPKLTVVKLKLVAEAITRQSGINLHLRSGERKQDVVDK